MSGTEHERIIDFALEIAAPPAAVWRALTEADELERWFPLDARVRPGTGGGIWLSWGPPWQGECAIQVWEPARRLRASWPFHPPEAGVKGGATPLAVDFHLEGRGAGTVLRVVHSGFGDGSGWDGEYEGTRRGWRFELRSLKHYLERQRGEPRGVAWVLRRMPIGRDAIWSRLAGRDGLCRAGSLEHVIPGDRVRLELGSGDVVDGDVLLMAPPADFACTAENLGGALFRVCVENLEGAPALWLWISLYGRQAAEAGAIEERWGRWLERVFPEGETIKTGAASRA